MRLTCERKLTIDVSAAVYETSEMPASVQGIGMGVKENESIFFGGGGGGRHLNMLFLG